MKKLVLGALLALAFCAPARAGNPTPLTVQIDRSQNPSPICFNRLTSASGCQTVIGYVDSSNVWTPLGPGSIPFPPSFSIDTTNASNIASGTLACARLPASTGDVTSAAGSCVRTLATVNSNVGTYGDAGTTVSVTVDAKGRITAVSTQSIQAPAGQLTGPALATGVTQSSLTQVGTITAGTWQGTPLATAYISDQAVTNAKLAPATALTIKSNITGSAASPSDNSLSSVLDAMGGSTRGSILYRGASGWAPATPAAAGYVWTSNGAGADPSYQPSSVTSAVGFRNRIVNGDMSIDQRNSGAAQTITAGAALAYTVDRWYAYSTGANVTGQRVTNAGNSSSPSQNAYQFTGAASVTAINFCQRIAAERSYDLAGGNATLSLNLDDSQLTSIGWSLSYANSTDSFGTVASPTVTSISSGSFTVSSASARYSTTISIPAGATTGLQLCISWGAKTSGTGHIGNVQLEAGSTATAFERRPGQVELAMAYRYAQPFPSWSGVYINSTVISMWGSLPVPMRSSPSATLISSGIIGVVGTGTFAISSIATNSLGSQGGNLQLNTATSAGGRLGFYDQTSGLILLSAEL